MKWIDTHAHLYFDEMHQDLVAIMKQSLAVGVDKIVQPAVNAVGMEKMLEVSFSYPQYCFSMIGIHPCYVNDHVEQELARLRLLLEAHPERFIAIGEIGLDFYHDMRFVRQQEWAFEEQLKWAKEFDLPIAIHSRHATKEAWNIVKKYMPLKGVFHCFGEQLELAQELISGGMYLGIGGIFTYPKNRTLRDTIDQIGLDHIVLETDAPYLAPVPYRGKRNEPAYIPLIGQAIASHLSLDVSEVAAHTTRNAACLFNLE